MAKQLLEYLMEYSHHDNRSVLRNNLEIIKTLMESWKDKLQAPTKSVPDVVFVILLHMFCKVYLHEHVHECTCSFIHFLTAFVLG